MTAKITAIEDFVEGRWSTVEVAVREIWDKQHDSIRQTGLLEDDTGVAKFVSWEKSNLPLLEEGASYRIGKVPVSEYDGYLNISLVKTTKIERIDSLPAEIPTV